MLSTTGSLASTLGVDNPFRYKGYYYDFETGLYLLTTRYYNPEWGRWLSADAFDYLDPQSINGLNLFAYCNNNPVMYKDSTGCYSFLDFLTVVGRFIGGVAISVASGVATINLAPLFLIPGAAAIPLFTTNMMMYGAMVASSSLSSTIKSDMELINWNPFNNNESIVIESQNVSFYKGVMVIRYGDADTRVYGGFSFGIIGIKRGTTRIDIVSHEYGHHKQQQLIGIALYIPVVAIPSLISANKNTVSIHRNQWYEKWATNWGNLACIW